MGFLRPGNDHPAVRSRRLARACGTRFDGNFTSDPTNWMFPIDEDTFNEIPPEAMEALMARTAGGNLSWVVFPPAGFRL